MLITRSITLHQIVGYVNPAAAKKKGQFFKQWTDEGDTRSIPGKAQTLHSMTKSNIRGA